jgi:hypothetical protein
MLNDEVHASSAPISYGEQNSTIAYHANETEVQYPGVDTHAGCTSAALITGFKESSGHLTGEAEFKNRREGYRITYGSGESRPTPHLASFFRRFPARDAL